MLKRRLRDTAKRGLFGLYKLGTRLGYHVVPVHYYSPIADLRELERTRDVWAKASDLPGIHVDLDEQARVLRETCRPYEAEYRGNKTYLDGVSRRFGPGYGYVEAQALHGVIRHFKPKRILEVGSGVSTHCMLAALGRNSEEDGATSALTCIEPYPSLRLKESPAIELIVKKVQTVPADVFTALDRGDLLFIDSSHTVKPGSDVNYLFLEILPRLRPGVIVHVHDIYLPYDYGANVLKTFFHWSETSLLRAFLVHNARAKILFCLSHLHYERQSQLKEVFPEYDPDPRRDGLSLDAQRAFERTGKHFPSSIYFEICA